MKYYLWWPFQIAFTLISIFFTLFGIDLLVGSYSLKDPFNFIMTFFAASLMILISITLAAGFISKMVRVYRSINYNLKRKR
jgi:hypothetical protein